MTCDCDSIFGWRQSGVAWNANDMMNANAKPARPKDLTPRQIEWCRSHIPAFMPKVMR